MMRFLVFVVMASLLFAPACSKEEGKKVYSTPEGKVAVTRKEAGKVQEMTVKTKEGTMTMKTGAEAIPKDLGVPVYPGVEKEEGGTWSMSGTGEQGEQGFSSTILFSRDPLDKVSAFYKEKLREANPQTFEMAMPNGKMVHINIEKGDVTTHIVLSENKAKGGTNIQISKAKE